KVAGEVDKKLKLLRRIPKDPMTGTFVFSNHIDGSANLTGNKIRNNQGLGVFLDSRSKLSYVRHNEIVRNQGDGISIPFGNNGIIEDNTIAGNDGMGVFCRTGYGPQPKIDHSNVIEGNRGDVRTRKNLVTCVAPKRR
ncbi:MAG: right-handed parallel beta-helix repeat-containing protein, partial [Parvularculaceae bacterium]|nr:right-handed parallel beta-helix repeat-containing protein [Parvularculaceae bacterium]